VTVRAAVYVGGALILIGFGYLALFSIGLPFALTGLLMLALSRWHRHPDVLAPALIWPWVFTIGYLLIGPLGCTSTSGAIPGAIARGVTTCNGVFFDYHGSEPYNPPLMPAAIAGVVLATVSSLALRWLLRRRSRGARAATPLASSRG
jgi:hypothetical protein